MLMLRKSEKDQPKLEVELRCLLSSSSTITIAEEPEDDEVALVAPRQQQQGRGEEDKNKNAEEETARSGQQAYTFLEVSNTSNCARKCVFRSVKMPLVSLLMVLLGAILVVLVRLFDEPNVMKEEIINTAATSAFTESDIDPMNHNGADYCFFNNDKGFMLKSCPDVNAYHKSCRQKAISSNFPPPQELADPQNFVPRLLNFFQGKKVALVGDSLTRQWFETLSCRLGMDPTWYPKNKIPARLKKWAVSDGILFKPMNAAPRNYRKYGKVYGYARSLPSRKILPKKPNMPCRRFKSSLEYYHIGTFSEEDSIIAKTINAIAENSDVIIVNIGAHYRADNDSEDLLDIHLKEVMNTCGEINMNSDKQCFFRETLPAHFQFKSKPCGEYIDSSEENKKCGPIKKGSSPSPMNRNIAKYGEIYNVPIVNASVLKDFWRWHNNDHDCRHFCEDNEVWDLLHESLLQAADAFFS